MAELDYGYFAILAVVIAALVLVGAWFIRVRHRGSLSKGEVQSVRSKSGGIPIRGILVPGSIADSKSSDVMSLLEKSSTPVAIEYFPLADLKTRNFELVPVNQMLQKAVLDIVKLAGEHGETLYRVVLPKGAELAKAVGQEGFRGFSRTGGKMVHGVFTPVVVGGAAAVSWPIVAVTGTMLVLDGVAQHQQRVHQQRVESILSRQESRYFEEQLARQITLNKRISREVAQIQDGKIVSLEDSRTQANLLFATSKRFLEETQISLDNLGFSEGPVDVRKLEISLGGKSKDVDYFFRRLHLAHSAIALEKRAVIAYAASIALADPTNPYQKLQTVLREEAAEVENAEEKISKLTASLASLEMKGNWFDEKRDKLVTTKWAVSKKQGDFRGQVENLLGHQTGELQFTISDSGELLQIVTSEQSQVNEKSN